MYASLNGTEAVKSRVWCHRTHEDRVSGTKSSSRVVMETTDRRGVMEKMRTEASSLSETERTTKSKRQQSMIAALLSKKSLAKCPRFMRDMCGSDGVATKNLYLILTF